MKNNYYDDFNLYNNNSVFPDQNFNKNPFKENNNFSFDNDESLKNEDNLKNAKTIFYYSGLASLALGIVGILGTIIA